MNKFDETYLKIKKIISEEILRESKQYFIDLDLDLINEKYCDGGISYDDLMWRVKDFYGINIISLDDQNKCIRIESDDKKLLEDYLGTFINSKKFDETCAFIRSKDVERDELNNKFEEI